MNRIQACGLIIALAPFMWLAGIGIANSLYSGETKMLARLIWIFIFGIIVFIIGGEVTHVLDT